MHAKKNYTKKVSLKTQSGSTEAIFIEYYFYNLNKLIMHGHDI